MSCSTNQFTFSDDKKTLKCVGGVVLLTIAMLYSKDHYANLAADFGLFFVVIATMYTQVMAPKEEFNPFDEIEEREIVSQECLKSSLLCLTSKVKEVMMSAEKKMKVGLALVVFGYMAAYISLPILYAMGMLLFIAESYMKHTKGMDLCHNMKEIFAPHVQKVFSLLDSVPKYSKKGKAE